MNWIRFVSSYSWYASRLLVLARALRDLGSYWLENKCWKDVGMNFHREEVAGAKDFEHKNSFQIDLKEYITKVGQSGLDCAMVI